MVAVAYGTRNGERSVLDLGVWSFEVKRVKRLENAQIIGKNAFCLERAITVLKVSRTRR